MPRDPSLRNRTTLVGLVSASLAVLANAVFLMHGTTAGRRGFPEPPVEPWLAINMVVFALWLVAILSLVIGKGWKNRTALGVCVILMALVDYGAIMLARD